MTGEIKSSSDTTAAIYGARESNVRPKTSSDAEVASSHSGGSAGADTVMLTDRAQQMLRLEGQLADIPAVDSKRVESIRASIADGSFQVDAPLIAERMLQLDADQKKSGI
jgi:negative regulator of flagellin synthesis FlgM